MAWQDDAPSWTDDEYCALAQGNNHPVDPLAPELEEERLAALRELMEEEWS